jgi:hypothetical protein
MSSGVVGHLPRTTNRIVFSVAPEPDPLGPRESFHEMSFLPFHPSSKPASRGCAISRRTTRSRDHDDRRPRSCGPMQKTIEGDEPRSAARAMARHDTRPGGSGSRGTHGRSTMLGFPPRPRGLVACAHEPSSTTSSIHSIPFRRLGRSRR